MREVGLGLLVLFQGCWGQGHHLRVPLVACCSSDGRRRTPRPGCCRCLHGIMWINLSARQGRG